MHVTVEKMLLDILNFQEPQDIYGRHNATCIVDIGSMVSRVLWSPEGLVEVRVSWPGQPRYQKKKKKKKKVDIGA